LIAQNTLVLAQVLGVADQEPGGAARRQSGVVGTVFVSGSTTSG